MGGRLWGSLGAKQLLLQYNADKIIIGCQFYGQTAFSTIRHNLFRKPIIPAYLMIFHYLPNHS
ncbi:hypothetical protein EHB58_10105 [Salmonella enterica subsp. enterica serovar Hull]|uniref:Uncharacterized protein n=1 Tax=Salmonella enterica subsp. enterica serovar Hull TaxID=1403564 RepID=A0A5X4PEC1_SALET|nr:hypothetical protein [Salmonella enterica subsp. enterica serovar Hull]EBZ8648558.1 hypothetical protein [Salmonella enterica subsp. enterica serovar Hull]